MKKIVGIIAALALAGSVFARPDITPVITSFNGNAKVEWIANLDADKYGFANSTWTEWKIQTKSADWGGESNKSADGMWGELVLRTQGDKTFTNPGDIYAWGGVTFEVSTAKVHFIDGDTYLNVDILKPDFQVGEIGYIRALKTNKNTNNWEDNKFTKVGGYDYDPDAPANPDPDATNNVSYHGITVNFGIPMVDLTFAFGDDRVNNAGKSFSDGSYAFKFAATVKPIDGLNLYAGLAKCTEEGNDDLALAFTAGYNLKIDDQFYVKPAVQFDMYGKKSNLGAAVFFGWGAEGQTWNHDFLTFAYTQDTDADGKKDFNPINVAENGTRTADGLSVVFTKGLKDNLGNDPKSASLIIEAYDNKLLNDLGLGSFTWAAAYRADDKEVAGVKVAEFGKGAAAFGLIYNNTFDIVYLTTRFSFGIDLSKESDNTGIKYGLKVGTKELIANTDLYLDYVAGFSKYSPADDTNKGTLTLGCQINF
jgi:hypothetical protein